VERHVVAEEVFRLAAEPGTPVRAVHGFGGVTQLTSGVGLHLRAAAERAE
jgi:hypothetical protein